jgi:hypothetical protein
MALRRNPFRGSARAAAAGPGVAGSGPAPSGRGHCRSRPDLPADRGAAGIAVTVRARLNAPGVGRCRIFGRTDVRTPPDQLPTVRRPQDARWLHYAAECRRPRLAARSGSAPHHGSHRPMTRARFQSVWHHGHAQCVLRAARGLLEFGGLATAEEAGTHAPLRRFCDARAGALWSICSRSPGFEQDWAPSTPPQPPACSPIFGFS